MTKNYLIILTLLICSYGGYSQWNGVQDELVSFEAKELNQKIKFTWVVRAEINTENYSIKRSIDGINFEEIVQIKSKGNSPNQRTYIEFDNDPIIGTIFYTLLSQDYNGDTLFSKTIAFDNDYETPELPIFEIYPNPNSGNTLTVDFISLLPEEATIVVTDINGRLVQQASIATDSMVLEIDLIPGLYLISVVTPSDRLVKKLLIE